MQKYSSSGPSWVDLPPCEPGSIDPLGYLSDSERLAEQLLPGVTIATRRVRYLSFLCWAMRKTDNRPKEIDRWEVALAIGESLRHGKDKECSYLGTRRLRQINLARSARIPTRLHIQTARILYFGLLRSCGLVDEKENLLGLGTKIADSFGKQMPRSMPKRVSGCADLPCLSETGSNERTRLKTALFATTDDSIQRARTFREVGTRSFRETKRDGPATLLKAYLSRRHEKATPEAGLLRDAASLELESLPLTRVFLHLYTSGGTLGARFPKASALHLYNIGESPPQLMADVSAHLRLAASRGREVPPLSGPQLKAHVLNRHRNVKAEAPWVDMDWNVLRFGLKPQTLPNVHEYRLTAFASLLTDVEVI